MTTITNYHLTLQDPVQERQQAMETLLLARVDASRSPLEAALAGDSELDRLREAGRAAEAERQGAEERCRGVERELSGVRQRARSLERRLYDGSVRNPQDLLSPGL